MGSALRILHTADSHIGAALPVRPRRGGRRRGDDLVDSFAHVLGLAVEHDADIVIHAGDLFNRSKPSSRALAAAAGPLLKLAAAGIPVVIVPGNHERSTIPTCLLLSHPNIHIIAEPGTVMLRVRGMRVAISGFPCLRRDSARRFASVLEATGWRATPADAKILAVHQTFESATCGPAGYRFRKGEDVIDREAVPAAFDYVAAGHVHRHQTLATPDTEGPPIVYSGSCDRVSFAELDEPKGGVIVEEVCGRLVHRFIEHHVRPLCAMPMDVTGLTRQRIREQIDASVKALPPQAVAQVRLTGCVSPGTLRGLHFTATARDLRPDVLLSVSSQAVEFVPRRTARLRSKAALEALGDPVMPGERIVRAAVADIKLLPTGCGVYALHDAAGRLLYIGKSKNLRTRVRTHLRGKTGANFFTGWTRQIARIDAAVAHSELEALLIEAELIRTCCPPFNRAMRKWNRYCYLAEKGKPYRQLAICPQPTDRGACFGPYRSRKHAESVSQAVASHFGLSECPDQQPSAKPLSLLPGMPTAHLCDRYYRGLCVGPCADRVTDGDYEARVLRRNALLRGIDDTTLRRLEERLEAAPMEHRRTNAFDDLSRRATTLRAAFNQAVTLGEAEELMGGLLLMPAGVGLIKTATPTSDGIRFDVLAEDARDAGRILAKHARLTGSNSGRGLLPGGTRLPRTVMDGLCIAARHLRRPAGQYGFISRKRVRTLNGRDLVIMAFEGQVRLDRSQSRGRPCITLG